MDLNESLQLRNGVCVRFRIVAHDAIVALCAPVVGEPWPGAALDIVVDRISALATDVHRTPCAASWSLAGAQHTACETPRRLAIRTVLAEDCHLGIRECEQTLAGANRYLSLTRWLVDSDPRTIVARSEIDLTTKTWCWATRTFAVVCGIHAAFAAELGTDVLRHCEPAKLHVDQSSSDGLLRAIQEQLAEIDLPYLDLDVVADALRQEGTGVPALSGERLHVPLGALTCGATLELRLDEHHPALGVGLLVLLSVPGSGDRIVDHRLAAGLNRGDDVGLGPWVPGDHCLEHATFLPAALLDDATQRPDALAALALADLRRARCLTSR